eukprot:4898622-Alexandrium_andersonii.AAC.1
MSGRCSLNVLCPSKRPSHPWTQRMSALGKAVQPVVLAPAEQRWPTRRMGKVGPTPPSHVGDPIT